MLYNICILSKFEHSTSRFFLNIDWLKRIALNKFSCWCNSSLYINLYEHLISAWQRNLSSLNSVRWSRNLISFSFCVTVEHLSSIFCHFISRNNEQMRENFLLCTSSQNWTAGRDKCTRVNKWIEWKICNQPSYLNN